MLPVMLKTLKYTVIAIILCWAPLLIVGGLGISDNPIGLGILVWVLTPVVLVVAAIVLATQLATWALSARKRG